MVVLMDEVRCSIGYAWGWMAWNGMEVWFVASSIILWENSRIDSGVLY